MVLQDSLLASRPVAIILPPLPLDFKGQMRAEFFESSEAWKKLMQAWRRQAEKDPSDRSAFFRLLRPNAALKKRKSGIAPVHRPLS